MPPSDIYLVRHGQSTWNAAGRWQGQADPPLSPLGERQAAALARRFPSSHVTHVVASDLQRAHATAVPLARRFDVPIAIDPDLREIDVGDWSGKTRDELHAEDPAALDLYYRGQTGWNGGESYEQHHARATRALHRIDAIETDDTVVAVTHGGTLRAMVLELLELDPAARWRFSGIGHASVTHVTRGLYGWRLASFNALLDIADA